MAAINVLPTPPTIKDLTGTTFGSLVVVGFACRRGRWNRPHWWCLCVCGTTKTVAGGHLLGGDTVTCGCHRGAGMRTHGMGREPTYRSWQAAKERCHNPHNERFPDYGQRGIIVCDRWRNSFDNFLADMGVAPDGHTLERIDVNGNYQPDNCRWATPLEQANNKRNNRRITFNGETKTVNEWARSLGMGRSTILTRIDILGWPVAEAMQTPLMPLSAKRRQYRRHLHRRKYLTPQIPESLFECATGS